ncbi:type II secretion system protein GspH [Marinobacter halodurans]|uniref:Type II secretion system protein H n=1 Tax=Marinobacter halodurans TaxID=2528979 RepID=A0ABY1ZKI4_9GAMM|nr:type II secretion system minor pseudopilin GspH [Marinobacter halodurans]TBW56011.1 type II secretion system protein GspH [Marinobacter halodurans]
MSRSRGFTLIEIMVVLVLVGLLAVIAVVNLGGGAQQRELENRARELFLLMQTASEQAVLNNQELGLLIDDNGYRFLMYDDAKQTWGRQKERLFAPRQLPEWMAVVYHTEDNLPKLPGTEDDEESPRPDIVFYSSGETTPFDMELAVGDEEEPVYRIDTDGLNGLKWHPPGEEKPL